MHFTILGVGFAVLALVVELLLIVEPLLVVELVLVVVVGIGLLVVIVLFLVILLLVAFVVGAGVEADVNFDGAVSVPALAVVFEIVAAIAVVGLFTVDTVKFVVFTVGI